MDNIKLPKDFYIAKKNYDKLIPEFSKQIESMVKYSWEFRKYLEYIHRLHLLAFPIPLSVIIRSTTMEHINLNKRASAFGVSKSIMEKLFSGKISYVSFNDSISYIRVCKSIKYVNSETNGPTTRKEFYNNKVFPLVEEHFSMQQVEMEELKKLINGIYGMESEESEYCDECKAYMTFWMKYCEYKGTKIY